MTLFRFNYFYFVNDMSEERRAAREDRRLRSQVQPSVLEESNNDPLERFMIIREQG